ncbi:MAG: WD40 repeat domain-containing protein [Planctomycetia bacterium]|nr:WD40 repeat domain-containing protein [Planctomycetia bacterium]
MQKLLCPRNGVWDLTFSPDGDMLAGLGNLGGGGSLAPRTDTILCWTRSRGWEQTGIRHRGHQISSVVFHPSGRTLAYCGQPSYSANRHPETASDHLSGIRLYSLTSESQFDPDHLLTEPVDAPANAIGLWYQRLAFTPDGRTLLANRIEHEGFWPTHTRTAILHWHFTPIGDRWHAVNTSPERTVAEQGAALLGTRCVVFARNWGIHLSPLDPETTTPPSVPDVTSARLIATAPNRELIAVADMQQFWVWHLRESKPLATWPVSSHPSTLALSPDGRTLAAGDSEKTVTFWDTFTGSRGSMFDFGVGPIYSLAFAPDGFTLAVAGRHGLVVVDVE